MNEEDFNIPVNKARVLVAPLDWGLGHATRCLPIISKLIQQNCEVFVAAETTIKKLIEKEFPHVTFIQLKGYRVQYSRKQQWLPLKLLAQMPRIFYRIYAERKWLKKAIRTYKIDAVISDNRPGLSNNQIPCIYITHQLQVITGNGITDFIVRKIHFHFINKFTGCWVPDTAGSPNLAGRLSHPERFPKTPVTYIGPLSRFVLTETEMRYDCCIVLSGPEPQRTIFEKLILKELHVIPGKLIFIRGLPSVTEFNGFTSDSVEIENHLPAAEMNRVILQSKFVICRSGYSSIMDLVKLHKKALLVPTPGQTEQEYLGDYLHQQQFFLQIKQQQFSLSSAMQLASSFVFKPATLPAAAYESVLEEFVQSVINGNQ